MKVLKIIAVALAVLGAIIALYGVGRLSDYQKIDKAWQQATDARNDLLRHRDPATGEIDPMLVDALERESIASDVLSKARDHERARCQRVVQASMLPLGLGLILGIVGLTRKPRGWLPAAATVSALVGGGLIGSMLGAGVF